MADQGRRSFFSDLLREGAKAMAEFRETMEEARQEAQAEKYFDTYESSYALTLCEEELMMDSARLAGIETEGRDRNEIARELFAKQGSSE
jgi:nitrate reductase assembly molybdenum cofactor insertion protein NarJ